MSRKFAKKKKREREKERKRLNHSVGKEFSTEDNNLNKAEPSIASISW